MFLVEIRDNSSDLVICHTGLISRTAARAELHRLLELRMGNYGVLHSTDRYKAQNEIERWYASDMLDGYMPLGFPGSLRVHKTANY